jgi:hypothetical protein
MSDNQTKGSKSIGRTCSSSSWYVENSVDEFRKLEVSWKDLFDLILSIYRHQEFVQELNGILEQNIRNSNCVDLESLCINAGELVREYSSNSHQDSLCTIDRFGRLKSILPFLIIVEIFSIVRI